MQASPRARARKQLIFALALLVVAIAGYLVTRSFTPRVAPVETTTSTTGTTDANVSSSSDAPAQSLAGAPFSNGTLEGTYVCLPHKKGEPPTKECALGIRADDGRHYALSTADATAESASATTPTGKRVRVTGRVVPAEASSNAAWQRYDIAGVIQVATLTRL